jgi:enoyl-CoA hydratase/carnithine racemase
MAEQIVLTQCRNVLDIRLGRPEKRNALTRDMYAALAAALEGAEQDADVRAVVFSGEGASFTAGNDLKDFLEVGEHAAASPVHRFLRALAKSSVPLVAAVQGNAVGIGTTMLLHCDFVVAALDASFRLPFADLGLVPEAASSLLLPRLLGVHRAASMLMLGDRMGADEAHARGLVHALAPGAEEARLLASEIAGRLAAKPAEAMRATRRLMRADQAEVLARMDAEAAIFAERLASAEFKAAAAAFFARAG